MDTLLVLLGVLGIGAIIIAIHVFSVEPGSYGHGQGRQAGQIGVDNGFRQREDADRRGGLLVVSFPLLINGTLVQEERRSLVNRRQPPPTT